MKRGEIYYIRKSQSTVVTGSEQRESRPAIIVSNNTQNTHSPVVEVVYLTTQDKPELPTHVTIYSSGKLSTALCEQVNSVSVERVGDYLGKATAEEMEAINKALLVSLGLSIEVDEDALLKKVKEAPMVTIDTSTPTVAEIERDTYKRLYEDLVNKLVTR